MAETKIRVRILEENLKSKHDGRVYIQEKDDQISVPRELAERWCAAGWAEDLSGSIETGERKPGATGIFQPNGGH